MISSPSVAVSGSTGRSPLVSAAPHRSIVLALSVLPALLAGWVTFIFSEFFCWPRRHDRPRRISGGGGGLKTAEPNGTLASAKCYFPRHDLMLFVLLVSTTMVCSLRSIAT